MELDHISFFDFIRYFSCELKSRTKTLHTPQTRVGVLTRYFLCETHPHHKTHELIRHTYIEQGDIGPELVPRIVGCKIPRKSSNDYKLFCLSHFKPFSVRLPLLIADVEETFCSFVFPSFALCIMDNWEEIHECQDERDAERLRKQASLMKSCDSLTVPSNILDVDNEDIDNCVDDSCLHSSPLQNKTNNVIFEEKALLLKQTLTTSKWLEKPCMSVKSALERNASLYSGSLPTSLDPCWRSEIKSQADSIVRKRRIKENPLLQLPDAMPEQSMDSYTGLTSVSTSGERSSTEPSRSNNGPMCVQNIMENVLSSFHLNTKQSEAFEIITKYILYRYVLKLNDWLGKDPLRMFLSGPGGTGKTHVVKAVKEVLRYFGLAHTVRFMAPTGTAANLIEGTTIHSGLGISIKKDKHGFNMELGSADEHQVSFAMSNTTRVQLRADWKEVLVLMIDEVSLLSSSLLAEVDAALRFAKEQPDDFFGNLNMIFCGDQFQYPPTAGRALYIPLSSYASRTAEELMNRLGRLAWKSINAAIILHSLIDDEKSYTEVVWAYIRLTVVPGSLMGKSCIAIPYFCLILSI